MAKSQVTFNKIEKEKKRLKKRDDKQKKKDARKADKDANGTSGIQFAYVDYNGNLTDTPPNPEMRELIDADTIELGIPKKENRVEEEPVAKEGKVSFYNSSKGFGFIIDNVSGSKYFVHVSGLLDDIEENDNVTYDLERGQKGMNAVRVKKI